jgi:hypothetical protein
VEGLHEQLDAMNAIAYSNASKKQQGQHVRNADTIINGVKSAKH